MVKWLFCFAYMSKQGEFIGSIPEWCNIFVHPPSPNKQPCCGVNGPNILFPVFVEHVWCRNVIFGDFVSKYGRTSGRLTLKKKLMNKIYSTFKRDRNAVVLK